MIFSLDSNSEKTWTSTIKKGQIIKDNFRFKIRKFGISKLQISTNLKIRNFRTLIFFPFFPGPVPGQLIRLRLQTVQTHMFSKIKLISHQLYICRVFLWYGFCVNNSDKPEGLILISNSK